MLRPRTIAAIAAARARGIHVIVVTGRMFRSVRPYVQEAGLDEPVICYQGAVVAEPGSGAFLLHVPDPARARARDDRGRRGGRLRPQLLRRRRPLRGRDDRVGARLRRLPEPADRGGRRPARAGSPSRRRSSSPSATRTRSTCSRSRCEKRFGGPHVHLEVAAVLPRVREPRGVEGLGARLPRRAARLHRRADGRGRRRRERPRAARLGRLRGLRRGVAPFAVRARRPRDPRPGGGRGRGDDRDAT